MGKVSRALSKRTGAVREEDPNAESIREENPVGIVEEGREEYFLKIAGSKEEDHASAVDEKDTVTASHAEKSADTPAINFPPEKQIEEYSRFVPVHNTDSWQERLAIANENFSGVAESFRKLRTLILHPEKDNPARSILMLSADPQEGKSFVCANLGVSFARDIRHRALLVDCDLRRPSLHSLFGLTNSRGVVDLLRDNQDIDSCTLPTGLAKLSIIPAGMPPGNPAELISSNRMDFLLNKLIDSHPDQLILLDSPPFQAAAETYVLTQLVDKIVLVVRWGKTGRENIKKMINQVGRDKIIGVVFNAFESNILDRKLQDVGYYNYCHPENY